MHEHLDRSGDIKSAVIAGNLDVARAAAGRLAAEKMLGSVPYIEELQQHAAEAAAAADLATAAAAVGKIGQTCGGCHRTTEVDVASEVDVTFGRSERPPQELQTLTTEMQRHLWAADRMWAGLITPSDTAWHQGADILTEVRLTPSDITDDPDRRAQFDTLVQRMRAVGERAGQASSTDLRSHLYGEFLSLCAACHTLTQRYPTSR
jgi:mono/diheme cytochrome c family protein